MVLSAAKFYCLDHGDKYRGVRIPPARLLEGSAFWFRHGLVASMGFKIGVCPGPQIGVSLARLPDIRDDRAG